tara:strand:+ start:20 stop:169 length:150 start_codon:yes stop_codon:yes gene_type:complete
VNRRVKMSKKSITWEELEKEVNKVYVGLVKKENEKKKISKKMRRKIKDE